VRFPESKNSAGPTRGKWNATQWLPPPSHVSVLTMNVRGLTPTWAGNSSAQHTVAGYPFKHISIWRLVIIVSTFLLLGGRHPPSMSSSPRASGSSSFYLLRKWIVVSHGYFDLLTYATSHSVVDRVLESDVGNIFAQDAQRLETGNVRIPDVGIIHKITVHVDPSRRCGQLETNVTSRRAHSHVPSKT
jgi:hypothetical protein